MKVRAVLAFAVLALFALAANARTVATPTPTPYCPFEYCSDGTYHYGCSVVYGNCTCRTDTACESGQCTRDGTACYSPPRPTPTPTPTPTATPAPCNDYCSDRIYYSGGYRSATGACQYAQSTACPYGCSAAMPGCAAAPAPTPTPTPAQTPTATPMVTPLPIQSPSITPIPIQTAPPQNCTNCTTGCYGDEYVEKACGQQLGLCLISNGYHCAAGCNNVTKCNFRLGSAQFVDKDNVTKPLRDAKVTARYVTEPIGGSQYCPPGQYCVQHASLAFDYDGYTDSNGYVVVPGVNLTNHTAGSLTVTVFLEDVNNSIAIHVYPDKVAVLSKTAIMNFSRPETYAMNLTFDQGEERVLAKIYYHAWEASYFTRVALGTPIDYLPPEEFWYKSPGCGSCNACHFGAWCGNPPSDDWIHFCDNQNSYDNVFYDASPTNMEWHEFGHHVMLDRFNCLPVRSGNNHGSWSNPNSTDSWEEGWAEFFSVMNLQYWNYTDQHDYWVGQPGSAINLDTDVRNPEEMAVASTLYRMLNHQSTLFQAVNILGYNNTVNGKDCVHLSRDQIWSVIGSQHTFGEPFSGTRYISSVWDLYRAFNDSSLPGLHGDCDNNGQDNLDEIFAAHGFFYDYMNHYYWESGEAIGYTKIYHNDAYGNPIYEKRYDSPEIPGNFIQLNVTNPDGSPAEEYNMTVSWLFDCGEGPGGYNYTVTVRRGEMPYFYPPTNNCNATANITLSTGTSISAPIPIDNQDYWQRYNASNPYVYSFAPQLQSPATPTPVPTATPMPTASPSPTPQPSTCPLGFILAGLGGIAVAVAWKRKR